MSFGITSTSSIKKPSGNLSNDIQLAFSPGDAVSSLAWSPVANHLAVASWDNKVRVYDVPEGSTGTGVAVAEFDGPVLSCDWSRVCDSPSSEFRYLRSH
jgi:WD40 repeat protein